MKKPNKHERRGRAARLVPTYDELEIIADGPPIPKGYSMIDALDKLATEVDAGEDALRDIENLLFGEGDNQPETKGLDSVQAKISNVTRVAESMRARAERIVARIQKS